MENIEAKDFDKKIIQSNKTCLVLFYATWCPFCSNFKPTFESASVNNTEKSGAIIDDDDNPLWDMFKIEAVPTMIAFQNGKIIARKDAKKHVGLTKSDMDSIVKELRAS